MRSIMRTWRYLGKEHLLAVLLAAPLISLLVASSTLHINFYNVPRKFLGLMPWYLAIASAFVMAIAFVESNTPRHRPSLSRYLAAAFVASVTCLIAMALLSDVIGMPPRRVVPGTNLGAYYTKKDVLPSVVFGTTLDPVVHCVIGMFVYVRLRNARLASLALQRAQLRASDAARAELSARLATARDRIDGSYLTQALDDIERAYWVDPAQADRLMDELIEFLRAAIPEVREKERILAPAAD